MSIPLVIATGALFTLCGALAERLASVWPAVEARRRPVGLRTLLLAMASGAAAAGVVARSQLPWWGTVAYLVMLAALIVLAATDLEQRRLPHLLLDPLIVLSAAFIPFNPAVGPIPALIGAAGAVALLGGLGLVIRGGVARGDLLLVLPIGFMLGFPTVFTALFTAAFAAATTSLVLLARRKVALRSYIPFGPYLVLGAVVALLLDARVLAGLR